MQAGAHNIQVNPFNLAALKAKFKAQNKTASKKRRNLRRNLSLDLGRNVKVPPIENLRSLK